MKKEKLKCIVCDRPIKISTRFANADGEWVVTCEICGSENPVQGPPPKAPKPEPKPKVQKTEAELVEQAANIIMAKQRSRNMLNPGFEHMKTDTLVNKDLWKSTDFYFSVVFQSPNQKYLFIDHFVKTFGHYEIFDEDEAADKKLPIQILNGMKMAKAMGLELKNELPHDYPLPNLELSASILDTEQF